MRQVRFGWLVAWGFFAAPAAAAAQTIQGVVVEDGTATGIAGAQVELFAKGGGRVASARTDSAGAFLLLPRRAGEFTLRLLHLGYVPVDSAVLRVGTGEAIEVQLRMGRAAIPLEPLVVTARGRVRLGGFYERMQRRTFGQFVSRKDIEARPGARNATDLLRGMAGIEVVSVGRGGSDRDPLPPPGAGNEMLPRVHLLTMRSGGGTCEPAILVDGRQVRQFRDTGIDEIVKPDMIEGVEIYPRSAGAPIEFAEPNTCGVVAFWTRVGGEGNRWSWERLGAGLAIGLAAFTFMVLITR